MAPSRALLWLLLSSTGLAAPCEPGAAPDTCSQPATGRDNTALLQRNVSRSSPPDYQDAIRKLVLEENLEDISEQFADRRGVLERLPARQSSWLNASNDRDAIFELAGMAATAVATAPSGAYTVETVALEGHKPYQLACSSSCGAGSNAECALTLALHGINLTGDDMALLLLGAGKGRAAAFDESKTGPFCAAFPTATTGEWDYHGHGADAQLIAAAIDHAASTRGVDVEAVSLLGYSSGAIMSFRLACGSLVGARVGAVVSYGGMVHGGECASRQHWLLVHGTEDVVVPYGGDYYGHRAGEALLAVLARAGGRPPRASPNVSGWLDLVTGINGSETEVLDADADTNATTTGSCTSAVLWRVNGAGHEFPDSRVEPLGASRLWLEARRFLREHRRGCAGTPQKVGKVKTCNARGNGTCANVGAAKPYADAESAADCARLCERVAGCIGGNFGASMDGGRPVCFLYGVAGAVGKCNEEVDLGEDWTAFACVGPEGEALEPEAPVKVVPKAEPLPKKVGGHDADLHWTQSFAVPYHDSRHQYVGGSEICFLETHLGKLYAFSSYWMDSKEGKMPAVVLRLDSPDATWQVEVDTFKEADLSKIHGTFSYALRGSILEELHITKDKNDKTIDKTILVAAAAVHTTTDGTSAISIFYHDKDTRKWTNEHLMEGKPSSKSLRKHARDIVVYRDEVVHQTRIFLLVGNFGVLSGVYDSDLDKIVWDEEPEPTIKGGAFKVRALTMTVANGVLYFSIGGQLWKRNNGAKPSWSVAWEVPGHVNTEAGGIRGLATLPGGKHEDSIIFTWTPDWGAVGVVIRLDGLHLKQSTETTLHNLYMRHMAGRAGAGRPIYNLGGYNNFYPVKDPRSGKTIFVTGFETAIAGNDPALDWNGYYQGATLALRRSKSDYEVSEVDGYFKPGGDPLLAARTFRPSPFKGEEHVLYMGGFDSNFFRSDNTAWIYKAGLNVVLKGATRTLQRCNICPVGHFVPERVAGTTKGVGPFTCRGALDWLQSQTRVKCAQAVLWWGLKCCALKSRASKFVEAKPHS